MADKYVPEYARPGEWTTLRGNNARTGKASVTGDMAGAPLQAGDDRPAERVLARKRVSHTDHEAGARAHCTVSSLAIGSLIVNVVASGWLVTSTRPPARVTTP